MADTPTNDTTIHEMNDTTAPDGSPVRAQPASTSDMSGRGRDITASTLVRLLGLPTKLEIEMLETKIDAMSVKISSVTSKMERLASQMPQLFSDFDRTNVQIADLREFMKKALSSIVAHSEAASKITSDAGLGDSGERKGKGRDEGGKKEVNVISSE